MPSKKPLTRKQLVSKLDRIAKLYARYKDAFMMNDQIVTRCITCGKIAPIDKSMHGGHFIKAGVYPVRWDVRNIHSQCAGCNTYLDGNEAMYAQYIVQTYGVDELNRLCDTKKKWLTGTIKPQKIGELRELLEWYEELFETLKYKPPKR